MLDSFAELTKSLLIPGSFPFLLFGVSIGVAFGLAGVRWRRVSLTILVTITAAYWIGGMPIVADTLATRFHAADSKPADLARLQGVRAIVVLGAGKRTVSSNGSDISVPDAQTILNAIEGARLYRLLEGRVPIIASGGGGPPAGSPDYRKGDTESAMIRDILVRVGVPLEHIELESTSRTTREQARDVAPLLHARQAERAAIVGPAVQLPRAQSVFRGQGLDPIAAPAPYQPGTNGERQYGLVPNGGALRSTERAVYDYMAWGYYALRGWL